MTYPGGVYALCFVHQNCPDDDAYEEQTRSKNCEQRGEQICHRSLRDTTKKRDMNAQSPPINIRDEVNTHMTMARKAQMVPMRRR